MVFLFIKYYKLVKKILLFSLDKELVPINTSGYETKFCFK